MPARLHHERVARSDAAPERWLVLAHGIFGAGSNWRGIARKLVDRRRDWGVVLVDLRLHGRSEAGEPPHTVAACAADLRALIAELESEGTRIAAVAGHSFGGKVVLATRPQLDIQSWMLDASPSARPELFTDPFNSVTRVLASLERAPKRWPHRDDFVAALVAEGHALPLAQWLAMNVVADGDAYALRLDTQAMRALLADYYALDLWDTLVAPGPPVEVVVADRSDTVDAATRERLAHAPAHVHLHHIDAGHWLHIEAPAAVVELFATHLGGDS